MKKVLSIIMVLSATVALMSGCGKEQPQTQTQLPVTTTQSQSQTQGNPQNKADTANFIGEEKAQEIALEKAGLTAADVIFDRTELDEDDGIWHYEIEFRKERIEYNADIKADDGTILSWEVDNND